MTSKILTLRTELVSLLYFITLEKMKVYPKNMVEVDIKYL